MKTANLGFIAMMLALMLVSACQEQGPRLRPLITPSATVEPEPEPEPEEITRPNGAVFIKNDFCACNNGKSVIFSGSTCTNFCASKQTSGNDILYMNFTVNDLIISQGFQSTAGWCSLAINESDNVRCVLGVRSESGNEPSIDVVLNAANSFTANISSLAKDKNFILTLTETSSGAKSSSIQVRKISDGEGATPVGPVIVQPVTQYTCINRRPLEDNANGDIFFENAVRLHFNFIEKFRPQPVPAGVTDVICHDIVLNGRIDNSLFPRLEETPGVYALWSNDDIRFFDIDKSGQRDINEIIAKKALDMGSPFASTPNLFFPLTMSSGPTINTVGNTAASGAPLGFYMSYFNDQAAGNVAYCPKQFHYNSANVALRAIGEVVQSETEGIYLAKRESLTFFNSESGAIECLPMDVIVVRESDIKRSWFYIHPTTRQPTQPVTTSQIRNNQIKFYYPFDFNTPYIKKSHQMEYTLVTPDQVGQGTCSQDNGGIPNPGSDGIPTVFSPHDRRFGCIPTSSGN